MLDPILACQFKIDKDNILLLKKKEGSSHPVIVAKAKTDVVLQEMRISNVFVLPFPMGVFPRGLRYISQDKTTYAMEYPAGPYGIKLPAFTDLEPSQLIQELYLPKHFICLKVDNSFERIVGLSIAVSYGHNFFIEDPVQTLFGMSQFEINPYPTSKLNSTYTSIGEFLATVHEYVMTNMFSGCTKETWDKTRSMPDQFSSKKKKDFFDFWQTEGELVGDWSFKDPFTSTLAKIMCVEDQPLQQSKNYLYLLKKLIDLIVSNDILPAELKRKKLLNQIMEEVRLYKNKSLGEDSSPEISTMDNTLTALL